jgi:hypothetical protein
MERLAKDYDYFASSVTEKRFVALTTDVIVIKLFLRH